MKKNTVFSFTCLLLVAAAFGQQPATSPQRAGSSVVSRTDTLSPQSPVDVLFATNDDCDLFINGKPSGTVSRAEFRYLKLSPGTHRYTARSRRTGDEWSESFTVNPKESNEVFMDVLFAVDQNAAQRQSQRNNILTASQPSVQSGGKKAVKASNALDKKPGAGKDAIEAVVSLLATNTVLLQGGSFMMGNNRAPSADEAEHSVVINPVFFGKYEVTQHQWETIVGYNPSLNKGCSTCPVENVNWEEAMDFVRKLNAVSGKKFRLPTEAEWEFAARLGGKAAVELAGSQEAFIKKTAWFFTNAGGKPHPVGLLEPNGAGVFDLTGNVSEWCLDWYAPGFYKTEFGRNNPEGPSLGKEKVVRGGNFKDYVGDRFRPSFRSKREPKYKSSQIGLRLVLEPTDQ